MNLFDKNRNHNKDLIISASDAKAVIFGIDVSIANMSRDAQKIFGNYIESVNMNKNYGANLAELSTSLESDQIDENHFQRVGGVMCREISEAIERMHLNSQAVDRYATRYFDLCERIAESIRIRDFLMKKTNGTIDIEKLESPV